MENLNLGLLYVALSRVVKDAYWVLTRSVQFCRIDAVNKHKQMAGRRAEDERLERLTAATQAEFDGPEYDFETLLRRVDAIAGDGVVDALPPGGPAPEPPAPPASPLVPREPRDSVESPAKRARSSPQMPAPVGTPSSQLSSSSPRSGSPTSPLSLPWQQRAQRAWEMGVQRMAEAQMGEVVHVAVGEEISIFDFVGGQWVLATVRGHDVARGLHELRDVGGRLRAVDLSEAHWLYASVFRGEHSLSQLARMA